MPKIRLIIEVPCPDRAKAITEIQNEWLDVKNSPFVRNSHVPHTGDTYYNLLLVPRVDWKISFRTVLHYYPERHTTEIRIPMKSLKISGGTFVNQGFKNRKKFNAAVKCLVRALLESDKGWKDTGNRFSDLK